MDIAWGLTILLLGLLAWGGQLVTTMSRSTAVRLGLAEAPADVDPVFDADVRSEAVADVLTLWTLPVAGLLLVLDESAWAYFGLAGGAIYLYFGVRGLAQRVSMRAGGIRVGSPQSVRAAIIALAVWATAGLVTVGLAVGELRAG